MGKPKLLFPAKEEGSEDCDCACEVSVSLPTDTLATSDLWRQSLEAQPLFARLPRRWRAIIHPVGPTPIVVLNDEAWELWRHYADPKPLGDSKEAFELAQRGFLQPESSPIPSKKLSSPQYLTAWLHLTNACNLACPYCYLRKTSSHMSWETGRKAIDLLIREALKYKYHGAKVKYAGGEPFLRFDFLQQMHEYLQQCTNASGLALRAVVISNGTLLSLRQLDYLRSNGIALAVSLDGLGADHDRQRPFPDGRGSFDIVSRNLLMAARAGVDLNVNVTITDQNLDGLPELAAWLLSNNLPFSLNFYRENDCAGSHTNLSLQNERLIEGMKKVYRVIEANLPPWSLLGRLTDRASLTTAHTHTCAAGRDYLVIDHQGRITQCQMLIGRKYAATVDDTEPLDKIRQPQPWFANLSVDEKTPCKTCPWRYWCAGGCPLVTYRATGRFDVRSPLCEVYQALYPEVLRLEALRLIKFADSNPS